MKTRTFLSLLYILVHTSFIYAQVYTVYDIQYNPFIPGGPSPYVNQRLQVGGIVTGIGINAGAGGTRSFFIQDRDTSGYHGLFVRTNRTLTLAVGDSILIQGTVQESNNQTQLAVFTNDSVRVISSNVWSVVPCVVPIALLVNESTAEPYEGMFIGVPNVSVSAILPDGITISDGTHQINVKGYGSGGRWNQTYAVGDSFRWVKGNLRQISSNVYQLEPRSDSDFEVYGNNPPIITNVVQDPVQPLPNQRVTVRATITDEDGVVAVWMNRIVNNLPTDSIPIPLIENQQYEMTMGPWWWGTTVRYRILAKDALGAIASTAERTFTVNFPNNIVPIQFIIDNPDSLMNRTVQVEGVVVYIQGRTTSSGSMRTDAYLADTSSGIGLYISEAAGPANFPNLKRGYLVRMNATVSQYSGALQVSGAASMTAIDTGYGLRNPIRLRTGDYPLQRQLTRTGNPAYYASGSFVEVTGRIVSVDPNVGGGTNMLIDDGSGTMIIRIWDSMNLRKVRVASGDSLPLTQLVGRVFQIRGVASQYNNDFQMLAGYAEDFIEQDRSLGEAVSTFVEIPAKVLVPDWNEQVTIRYGAPSGSRIILRIFNMKGQLIATLIDKTSVGVGEFLWDGKDEYRRKLPLGTYLLQIQSNQNGTIKQAVAPIVIGTKL
ncbi:MAG: hypothetical protein N2450_00875 [bacterium]|nr:hypothetical protein [bacterium]